MEANSSPGCFKQWKLHCPSEYFFVLWGTLKFGNLFATFFTSLWQLLTWKVTCTLYRLFLLRKDWIWHEAFSFAFQTGSSVSVLFSSILTVFPSCSYAWANLVKELARLAFCHIAINFNKLRSQMMTETIPSYYLGSIDTRSQFRLGWLCQALCPRHWCVIGSVTSHSHPTVRTVRVMKCLNCRSGYWIVLTPLPLRDRKSFFTVWMFILQTSRSQTYKKYSPNCNFASRISTYAPRHLWSLLALQRFSNPRLTPNRRLVPNKQRSIVYHLTLF